MPSRPFIPSPGTPVSPAGTTGSMRDVLAQLADRAGRQNTMEGIGGIASPGGTALAAPQRATYDLFQLTENFNASPLPAGETWPFQPGDEWFHASATRLE